MLSHKQELQNLPQSRLNSHSFKSRLIPSFLALSVMSALYSPLSANWTINKSDTQNETQSIDATISSNITLNSKHPAISTTQSGSGQLSSLTIQDGVTIRVNVNCGYDCGHGVLIDKGTSINSITNNGHINTQRTGIIVKGKAETITIAKQGRITTPVSSAIHVFENATVNHINMAGNLFGFGIRNFGTIGASGQVSSPNGIKITGTINSPNNRAPSIENRGTIHGGIKIEDGATIGLMIYNAGVINGGISIKDSTVNANKLLVVCHPLKQEISP